MRKSSLLLQCLVFCAIGVSSSDITTTHIDFAGTYQGDMSNLLTRVEKKVDIKYAYGISGINTWNQFQGMFIEFELQFAQYVSIQYCLNIWVPGQNWFLNRVLIDGQENTDFRRSSGNVDHHVSHFASDEVWLETGKHIVKVEYRTGKQHTMGMDDWNNAYFKIRYFKK